MGIIGSSYIMVRGRIGLKLSVMDVGNWVVSGVNAQGNRQADPMLMVWLVHNKVLFLPMPPPYADLVPKT